jgi:hypothetical protein
MGHLLKLCKIFTFTAFTNLALVETKIITVYVLPFYSNTLSENSRGK